MKLLKNYGTERLVDELRAFVQVGASLDICSPALSLFAFEELRATLRTAHGCRLITAAATAGQSLLGTEADRAFRNRLQTRWLARETATWCSSISMRDTLAAMPQSLIIATLPEAQRAFFGTCALTTDGIGLTPSNQIGLIQIAEDQQEAAPLVQWFEAQWALLKDDAAARHSFVRRIAALADDQAPATAYFHILFQLFKDMSEELDEDRIVRSATGIRDTVVWNKLFKFQRDGVIGAIDKLQRFGGCIIADSVGLGKTFEALAVIKYHELRNDRVLVLCPKRLRDNWTLYKANDRRNVLAPDRLNYDVLNHTDLSRDGGTSGDIDLSHVNWGNYDLVVIDESHNFRNKATHKDRETRYDRLMNRVIRAGVKTKVLMLSATPVNNRLTDLKNQIAFATEGNDTALAAQSIPSIETTVRQAQSQFNRWLSFPEEDRRPARLIEMLGFDYFKLLDLLTIARSRKHIEKYYGITETGRFPERRKPINIKSDVDLAAEFRPIREINNEIRRLTLGAYAPLRYLLRHKQAAYDEKYSTKIRGGESIFRQVDREESLVHLLRVNILKRMESSVASFALTIQRQLSDVERIIARIDAHDEDVEELSIDDIDIDDPAFESLLVGRKVKVLLQDVDRVRWRQDLEEDRNRLLALLKAALQVIPIRDAKLADLRAVITRKLAAPLNGANRKILIFTAFADTAEYLYKELAPWAADENGVDTALVTGAGPNRTTLKSVRTDLSSILSAFSPRSKERPHELAQEGEIDLLIGTDCISEGQNLQDCDFLVNYDIHWNPVRIIQRFGRIDRIGSLNSSVQLVNFWPNMELDEYINLEQRVSGRMVLLDVSATGEENVIEHQSGNQMNDLEYRRNQLQKLKDTVIDLEDLSSGVSIADLTLNDFRIELAGQIKNRRAELEAMPLGLSAVVTAPQIGEAAISTGVIFCLRAASERALRGIETGYPLAPHYLVHIGDGGDVLLPYTQVKQVLDRLKRLALDRHEPDAKAWARLDRATKQGQDMGAYQKLLARAVASIVGKKEERAVASLFTPGGTHAMTGEFAGINDFEVVAYLIILPDNGKGDTA
jgi:hypothetical protein